MGTCCVTSNTNGVDLREESANKQNFQSLESTTSNKNTFKEQPPMPEFEVRNRDSLGTAAKENTYEMMKNKGLDPDRADLSVKDSKS